ncbi:uncharacterized protein B0T15DRAFT_402521 [Chaetomium strumarium]|uniref:Rhodopsin domain-containing protein n=1 Tax=Chaetomium strumarium TaxID=1170767 RepID=A0AAJ0GPB2_9PEZI|nr:hypothetical protein B0T15DRAFT_402521 [Chaetomium strumarium]
MGLKGDAPWALSVMWLLAGLVFFFLLLRIYTRVVCLASYGIDDHVYFTAFVFLLIFTIFTTLAGNHGFGQTMDEIGDIDQAVRATLYECIGQGFAIVGMAIAKASLGFFLLRLVTIPWHRIAIWSAMTLVMLASIAQVLCFWLSCVPLNYVYDRRIPGGYCPIDTRPTSYILCISTITVDFFFAVFPWIIVYPLQMPQREKYTIAGSMSLGLVAAAAGIKRTTEVEGLYTSNYLKDSVGLIVWSSAEMAVTLICIGIPVCRPLYKRAFRRLFGASSYYNNSGGYQKQSNSHQPQQNNNNSNSVPLRTIGGGLVDADGKPVVLVSKRSKKTQGDSGNGSGSGSGSGGADADRDEDVEDSTDEVSFSDVKLGVNGPFTRTTVGRGKRSSVVVGGDNSSGEEILGDEYRRNQMMMGCSSRGRRSDEEGGDTGGKSRGERGERGAHKLGSNEIMVTETFRVERSSRAS